MLIRRFVPLFITSLVFLLSLSGCTAAPPKPQTILPGDYEYTKKYASWLIRKEMKEEGVTGLSIALIDDQRVVWAEGFGKADATRKIPATPDTIYRVGSISKLFTATAVMQLAEQGKIDIDRPLQQALSGFSIQSRFPGGDPITPRHLLTHHSGIPSDYLKGMWTKTPIPFTDVVSLLKEEYVAAPPNLVFSYSNIAFSLLGHAVQEASGQPFVTYMDQSLLQPLGMDHSTFSPGPNEAPHLSKGYRKGKEAEEAPLRDLPAGGLHSTVIDLGRFIQMILANGRAGERPILKTETLAEMLRPQNADLPLDMGFHVGLGWMLGGFGDIDLQNAGTVAHHSGGTLYFHSQLIVLPEHKLGVVVLSNSTTASPAVHRVATETIKMALETKAGIRQPPPEKPVWNDIPLPKTTIEAFEGGYASPFGYIRIFSKGSGLRAETLGKTFHLIPHADGLLGVRYKLLGLIPISLGPLDSVGLSRHTLSSREVLAARIGNREMLVGEKIKPAPIPEPWRRRVGSYDIVNPGEDTVLVEKIGLKEEKGVLLIEYALPFFSEAVLRMPLAPLSDTEAVFDGLGRGMGETIRTATVDGEEVLSYSGYWLKRKKKE